VEKRLFHNLSGGSVTISLEKYADQKVRYRITAWDNALNCTLSEEKELTVK
jgi:hypothetical protein